MSENSQNKIIEDFERQLILKAKKMSNSELRDVLLEVRIVNSKEENESGSKFEMDFQKNLLMEGVYSQELKNRELLEWALKSGKK
ncbi:MAG: hypothetical protein ACTSQ0_07880 [Candidatus Heimdallarchaeota archaeon]